MDQGDCEKIRVALGFLFHLMFGGSESGLHQFFTHKVVIQNRELSR